VPSALFYPLTPAISYVQERLKPLQSVIADRSYLFSGTLGAYGIAEWYGHSFRTDREKDVLARLVDNPFAAQTVAIFDAWQIRLDSPLMDQLAIKFLLIDKNSLVERAATLALQESSPLPAPPLTGNSWRQHVFFGSEMEVYSFGFKFMTYGAKHAPADLRLTLYNEAGEQYSFAPEVAGKYIRDNAWVFFEFPVRVKLGKGDHVLELTTIKPAGKKQLSAWATTGLETTGNYLEVNGKRSEVSLLMRMGVFEKATMNVSDIKWKMIDVEKNIMILENRDVTNSAYFIRNLADPKEQPDFKGIEVSQPEAGLIEIDSAVAEAGWIVLPMRRHAGWKAEKNGQRFPYDSYLEILPAIPVKGAGRVTFRYQPDSFLWGMALSAVGVLIFAICSLLCLRNRRQTSH